MIEHLVHGQIQKLLKTGCDNVVGAIRVAKSVHPSSGQKCSKFENLPQNVINLGFPNCRSE